MKTKLYIADTTPLADPTTFALLYQTASPERKAKIDRLSSDKEKRLSLAADHLLQLALHQEGINDFSLETNQSGKPCLADSSGLCFNLSHSGERAICLLSDHEVGCDVERMRPIDFAVAKRFFAKEECNRLHALSDETARLDLFFRFWTLKESMAKAMGLPLVSACRLLSEERNGRLVITQGFYTAHEISFESDYRYAVCTKDGEEVELVQIHL